MQNDVNRLTADGYPWDQSRKTPKRKGPKRAWDESYADLVAYKQKLGHTNVPQTYSKLGVWVASQRTEYTRFLKGKKAALMTKEKVVKLNHDIGFIFSAIGRGARD
jgi:hypothetical protein